MADLGDFDPNQQLRAAMAAAEARAEPEQAAEPVAVTRDPGETLQ